MPGLRQATENESVVDVVRETFQAFDTDGDGNITRDELKTILQAIDSDQWTDAKVNGLLAQADTNGDGILQFTEFWNWICGKETAKDDDFQKIEFDTIVDQHQATIDEKQAYLNDHREKREAAEKKSADKAALAEQKAAERAAGTRITKTEFIDQKMAAGLSKAVATELYMAGDQDHDGDIDRVEMSELLGEQLSSVESIREMLRKNFGGSSEAGTDEAMQEMVRSFTKWDTDGDGTVSAEELISIVKMLNPKLGEKTTALMLQQADASHDGYVDIMEFVWWVVGKCPKKKKDQQKKQAQAELALHKQRSDDAKEQKLQPQFEQMQHTLVEPYARKKKFKATCLHLNPAGSSGACTGCKEEKHIWICHGCGFVSFYAECVNGCSLASFGWTCIDPVVLDKKGEPKKCAKKCGCKKKPDFWQRSGFSADFHSIEKGVKKMLEDHEAAKAAPAEAEAPPA